MRKMSTYVRRFTMVLQNLGNWEAFGAWTYEEPTKDKYEYARFILEKANEQALHPPTKLAPFLVDLLKCAFVYHSKVQTSNLLYWAHSALNKTDWPEVEVARPFGKVVYWDYAGHSLSHLTGRINAALRYALDKKMIRQKKGNLFVGASEWDVDTNSAGRNENPLPPTMNETRPDLKQFVNRGADSPADNAKLTTPQALSILTTNVSTSTEALGNNLPIQDSSPEESKTSGFPPCPFGVQSKHEDRWKAACKLSGKGTGWFKNKDLREALSRTEERSTTKRWLSTLADGRKPPIQKRGHRNKTEYHVREIPLP